MGKNDFLTPKAIANRIKAKGLQKLRWYCQMCQKQCRDENGFKCHCMSESHQRQMQVFGENPHRFVDGYSQEFESTFLEHVKRAHRFSRVAATVVYNEYINDRHHIHMNSTKWTTLTEFVKYLGKAGKCKVDETPKGWFITYIDREPETLLKENLLRKRERADVADELRHEKELEMQIERASKFVKPSVPEVEDSKRLLIRGENDGEKIAFSIPKFNSLSGDAVAEAKPSLQDIFVDDSKSSGGEKPRSASNGNKTVKEEDKKTCTLDELMKEEEFVKEKVNRKDYWITEGIVVKVMSKQLREKGYYKMKGVVLKVIGKYVGEIKMIDSGHVLRVDQAELETVIPQIGGLVKVVNGAYRGSTAKLLGIDADKFCAKVQITSGAFDGRIVPRVEYEDISKLASSK